jgi:uncharacterized membrane protein
MVKTTRFVLAFLFAFVFVIGLGSADLSIDVLNTTLIADHDSSVSGFFNISYSNSSQNLTSVIFSGVNMTFNPVSLGVFNDGQSQLVEFTINVHKHASGSNVYSFNANGTNGTYETSATGSVTVNVNPSSTLSVQSKENIPENTEQVNITLTNTGNQNLNNVGLSIEDSSSFEFEVITPTGPISPGNTRDYTINITHVGSATSLGSVSHAMTATSGITSATGTLTIERNYCRYGEVGGNSILITDVEDDDDFEWEPLMDVEVEVEVENNGDSSERVIVKLGLYDLTEGEFVDFVDGEDELEETIRISDGDEEVVTFNFKLPATIDPNNEYRLYVKAYESGEEDTKCNSWVEDVEVDSDYEVLMDDLDMPQILICGETNTISLRLHNLELGDDELMRVNLYSQELGLNIYSEEFELDEGDDEYLTLSFIVPENKESKSYRITFYAQYDYKESSDTFRESENLGSYTLTVDGDKCRPSAVPSISASLAEDTETIVGKDLKIEVTITNPSDAPTTDFIIALDDYTSWASSATLDQTTFSLAAGESKTITATFNPTKGGSQEFVVKAIYSGRVEEQRVTVSIDEKTTWLSRIADSMGIEANATFWLTIAIFIVLILIIVVLLVKFINSSKE